MHILRQSIKFFVSLVFLILSGCELLQVKSEEEENKVEETPVARVNETYLYQSDLHGMVFKETSEADSAARIERYVKNWVRKQLLIDEAKSKIDFDEADLERKILNYRYSLIAYQYQTYFINEHINKIVIEE